MTDQPGAVDLSARDLTIVGSIVTGSTYADAALLADCSERTVDRTMARPEVRAYADAVRQRRAAMVADLLDQRIDDALATLAAAMTDGDSTGARVTAARVVLDQARRWRDHADLAERVHALEDALRREQP